LKEEKKIERMERESECVESVAWELFRGDEIGLYTEKRAVRGARNEELKERTLNFDVE
jgi:hypothetical protein